MARAGMVDVGQAIEGELAIAFEALARRMPVFVVMLVARPRAHRIDQAAASRDKLEPGVKKSADEAVLK